MINREAMKRVDELLAQYKFNWGKEVDFSVIPPRLTQEKLVVVLERIVETGESLLVGYEKVKEVIE